MMSSSSELRRYKGDGGRYCSACRTTKGNFYSHPIFQIPICEECDENYHEGEFVVEDGNEIFCRWCGQGEEGNLLLCDTCPKSFCVRCVRTNFGVGEVERIRNLSDRWCCFICSPQSFRDLCMKHGWQGVGQEASDKMARRARQAGVVNYDISRGREKFEIPAINTVDDEPGPSLFIYVNKPVAGEGTKLTNNPNFLSCCSCTDNCSDPSTCECIINSGGLSYDHTGRLLVDRPAGIYECNYRCACNVKLCRNRVVSNGPSQRLEVFRCADPNKGWGVRCKDPLPPGTFIADYIGEIMAESAADQRGLSICDEYLYSLDCWGRSQACQRLNELGLKRSLESIPREYFVDSTNLTREKLEQYFEDTDEDRQFLDFLESKGKIQAMGQMHKVIEKNATKLLLQAAGVSDSSASDADPPKKKAKGSTATSKATKKGSVEPVVVVTTFSPSKHPLAAVKKEQRRQESLQALIKTLEFAVPCGESISDTATVTASVTEEELTKRDPSVAEHHQPPTAALSDLPLLTALHSDDNETVQEHVTKPKKGKGTTSTGEKQDGRGKRKKSVEAPTPSNEGSHGYEPLNAETLQKQRMTWFDIRFALRQKAWNDARSVIVDRCINEADERDESFIIDARWYGSVGRFLNHSCAPNLDKILVYCDTHDVTIPRLVFISLLRLWLPSSVHPILCVYL